MNDSDPLDDTQDSEEESFGHHDRLARYSPLRCPVVVCVITAAAGVAVAYGFPSNWVEWTRFDSIAICRVTLLENGNVSIPGDLLEQVKQGQIWRLVTPAFIHLGLMHLLVNAVLIYYLTATIEAEVGSWRILGMFVIFAATANFVQSFYSDLPFGGLSGIKIGMFGYRSMWQLIYPVHRLALPPMLIWIGLTALGLTVIIGMEPIASLRPVWFPRMADAGHVAGLLMGVGMAALSIGLRSTHRGKRSET